MTASSRVSPAPELPVPLDAQTPIRGESLRPPEQVSRLHLGRGHAALVQSSTEVVQRERDLHVLVIDAEGVPAAWTPVPVSVMLPVSVEESGGELLGGSTTQSWGPVAQASGRARSIQLASHGAGSGGQIDNKTAQPGRL